MKIFNPQGVVVVVMVVAAIMIAEVVNEYVCNRTIIEVPAR